MSEYKNKSVPTANSKTQVKRINAQSGRPAFYGLGWFITDKPLPNKTNYVWRENKDSEDIFLFSVRHNCLWYGDTIYKWEDYYKGEWFKIEIK